MSLRFTMGSGGIPAGSYRAQFIGAEPYDENSEKRGKWRCNQRPSMLSDSEVKEIAATDTAYQVLQKIHVEVELWQISLKKFPGSFWEDAELDDPGCVKRRIRALSDLASFLSSPSSI